jgi:hypothetical protein
MKKELYVTKADLEKTLKIVEENDLGEKAFLLIQENHSGIGYTTTMEFLSVLNGRDAAIRIVIADSDAW